jgi:dTDP-4-amino-4,6-dideoxygalactose transaminase
MKKLKEHGILCQVHYIPVTSQPYYSSKGYNSENYPVSLKFYNQALSIPLYYSLTDDDQEKVIKVFKSIVG